MGKTNLLTLIEISQNCSLNIFCCILSCTALFKLPFWLGLHSYLRTLCHWMVQLIYSNQFLLLPSNLLPPLLRGKMCLIPI